MCFQNKMQARCIYSQQRVVCFPPSYTLILKFHLLHRQFRGMTVWVALPRLHTPNLCVSTLGK